MTYTANEIDRLCREKEQVLLNKFTKGAVYEQPENSELQTTCGTAQ